MPPSPSPSPTTETTTTPLLLLLLSLQFGLQPLLNARLLSPAASKTTVVLATEAIKLGAAAGLLRVGTPAEERRRLWERWSVGGAVARAGAPAATYAVTNWLILLVRSCAPRAPRRDRTGTDAAAARQATRNLPALTLLLLNQTKTLSAALFSYALLGRTQTPAQVVALVMLAMGAFFVVTADEQASSWSAKPEAGADERDHVLGFAAITAASALSGLASALTERALVASPSPSWSLVFSMEIALLGIATLLFGAVSGVNADVEWRADPFRGWTVPMLLPCTVQALGGLLVGLVTQRAGGVRKGFALIAGLCLTCLLEVFLGQRRLVPRHIIAVALVARALWLHARPSSTSSSSSSGASSSTRRPSNSPPTRSKREHAASASSSASAAVDGASATLADGKLKAS